MLFDFPAFIEELREKEDKKEIVEKYEKYFWKIQWDIKDQIWYKDYLSKFPFQSYLTPEDLEIFFKRLWTQTEWKRWELGIIHSSKKLRSIYRKNCFRIMVIPNP